MDLKKKEGGEERKENLFDQENHRETSPKNTFFGEGLVGTGEGYCSFFVCSSLALSCRDERRVPAGEFRIIIPLDPTKE